MTDTPTARTDGPTLQRYIAQAREGCMSEPVVSFVADPGGGWTRYDKAAAAFDAAQARIAELEMALERDRSRVADIYRRAKAAICGHIWMMEGRGPYEWDDDDFRREFGAALKGFEAAIDPMREIAKDWSNCPTKPRDIAAARAALEARP